MSTSPETQPATLFVALAGNPNSGKTSLFNALTGLRHKVGNYPGVTVERIEGQTVLPDGTRARVVDVPGTYSLYARAEDERIARDVVLGLVPGMGRPDVVVCVVDATNLERNLYFTTQLMESGVPVCIALNMVDLADRGGSPVDAAKLEDALGVPVVPVVGRTGHNIEALKAAIGRAVPSTRRWRIAPAAEAAIETVAALVRRLQLVPGSAVDGEAIRLITAARDDDRYLRRGGAELREAVAAARACLEEEGIDRVSVEAECRYALCRQVAAHARPVTPERVMKSERVDRVLTHWLLGPVIYVVVMGLIFQSVYTWAAKPMEWIEIGTGWFGDLVGGWLGAGMLRDLLVDGVIAGVGNIVVFVPQICLLFFFLTLLEDVGYLSRAAFLVDRIMRGVGLHGKAFIPLMSSFACAIPGIMATRSIENRRDKLVTILVAPLMSCSARLPVYALMIGAFIPDGYQGLTLLGMYVLSVSAALGAAWVLRKTILRGGPGTFIMELPGYKRPSTRHVLGIVAERGWVFIRQAGTIILAISVVLWALAYFPRSEAIESEAADRIEQGVPQAEVENWRMGEQIRQSYAGKLGRAIEPAIEPLGFDWRTGIGIIASFAAREVLVSTMAIVYSVGEADEASPLLREKLRKARRPDGTPAFTWLSALSLMVFFVLACQCMSTLAVVKRETNSWRWPVFMFAYMTVLAYAGSLLVYQGGQALGLG